MSDQVITTLEEKIGKSLQSLKNEMNTIRAGRANPALLDKVTVNYYGTETPLKQLANVSIPDARTLVVTPFDPKSIGDIEHGIQAANIGINPVNDGKLIRLVVGAKRAWSCPSLTAAPPRAPRRRARRAHSCRRPRPSGTR